jgi:hypothetical protein
MLERKGGATAAQLLKGTGWQAHSSRGFISGTLGKKMEPHGHIHAQREGRAYVRSVGATDNDRHHTI